MIEILVYLGYLFVSLLVGLVTAGVIYARWNYGTLEKTKGVPVVIKPYFLGGSDPFFYKTICSDEDTKRVRKYGPIYGMYEGRAPQIFIADPELIRLIFIKDFDHFHNKRILDFGHPLINEMMDILPYDKWKVVRNYLSPQLTTGKIKSMSYQMLDAIDDWVAKIKTKVDGKSYIFTPKEAFTALTTDVIARCAFGTKINAFDDPNNTFVKYIRRLSFDDGDSNLMFTAVFTLPFLATLEPFIPAEVMDFFGDLLKNILQQRRKSGQGKINDFVDVMNDMIDKCSTSPEYQKLGITETTVMCQAMIFLLAGFETTASTLTLMAYHLSKTPELQDKVIKEVDDYLERHGKIDHETIGELVYINAMMNETLRMNAPLVRVERVCQKDWYHEPTGLEIKKGMAIQVPVYAVHFDEKYFPEPNEFKPERFLPENKDKLNPYAFLSFGQGPHNCIGMRFAKEEIQMTLATILKDFKFEDPEGAKLKIRPGRLFLNNYEPFKLNLVKRK